MPFYPFLKNHANTIFMYTFSSLHLNTPYPFFPARQRKSTSNQAVIVSPNSVRGKEAVWEPVRCSLKAAALPVQISLWKEEARISPSTPTQAVAHLLLLAAQICDLLLVLIVKPLHLLTGLLQVIVLPHQLCVFPLQGIHVLLQLRLVAQQPTVQRAVTAHKTCS